MSLAASIFFETNLPNAPTWFYASLLLAVALFFKFSRLLSVRNWDVVTLFLLVPGLLIITEANGQLRNAASERARLQAARTRLQVLAAQAVAAPGAPDPAS